MLAPFFSFSSPAALVVFLTAQSQSAVCPGAPATALLYGHGSRQAAAPWAGWGPAGSDGFAYCLDRGNGQVTRLIPADALPPLNEVPAREAERRGLVVLPARRHKVYCDKWIHEGVCAFTQQGCRFNHEMPLDEPTQRALGLFQGLPGWWRRRHDELGAGDAWAERGSGFADSRRPPSRGNPVVPFIWGPIGTPPRSTAADAGFCRASGVLAHEHSGPNCSAQGLGPRRVKW